MAKRKKKEQRVGRPVHYKLAKLLVRARAELALQDDEELEQQAAALVEQLNYATIGKKQSDAGKKKRKHLTHLKTRVPYATFNVHILGCEFPQECCLLVFGPLKFSVRFAL